jgi:serine/threonine-protein kinase RsbT
MGSANQTIAISTDADIIAARQAVRQLAVQLGFGGMDQSRIATAVSELARNVLRYATDGRGDVCIGQINDSAERVGIEIVVRDSGPGIADIERAMQQGFSSGKGLGLGLSGTKRLMDEMVLQSEAGKGTTVTIRKWLT